MQAVIILVILCCTVFRGSAQYININKDSLRREIRNAKADSTLSRLYGVLGWDLRFSDQQEAVRLADEMIRISGKNSDHIRLAEAYRIKGFVKVVNQDISGCLEMYALGIDHAKKAGSHYYLASLYSLTGGMYQDKGDFDKGIEYYLKGLREAEESKDPQMIAFVANNTGEIYSDAGRPIDRIMPFYRKALAQVAQTQNWQFAGMTWSNMAKDYLAAGQKKEAADAVQQSLNCLNRRPERAYVYGTVVTDIGEVLTGLGRYTEAEHYLLAAKNILDSLHTSDNMLIAISALAKMYVQSGNMQKAEQAGEELLQLAMKYHSKLHRRDAYKVLSDVARSKGDANRALQYYEQYKLWNDQVFNENKEKSIADVESRFKISEEARENEILVQHNNRLKTEKIIAIVVAVCFLGMALFLVLAYRATRNQNRLLETQKKIIENQSVEKDTLIREIHHRVKNNLQIVSGLLNLQAGAMTDDNAKNALLVSQKRVKAISLIHQNLYGFEDLASISLSVYIEQLFNDLRLLYNHGKVELVCKTDPEKIILDIETAVPLGLILNEAITNALKYAFQQTGNGIIRIDCSDHPQNKNYSLTISDNGAGLPDGFDPDTSRTLGFRIIRELTRQLRGQVHFTSNGGTIITIYFPYASARKK